MQLPLCQIDYSAPPPASYCCDVCGKAGVKLWREYNTFLDCTKFYCATCAMENQGKAGTVDSDGRRQTEYGKTDQIGYLIPAVPTEDGDTFWGYSSVPDAGCKWWRDLPTGDSKVQITFRLDGTAEHIGDQSYPAASLVAGPGRKQRASHIEPAAFWLRLAFHLARKAGLDAWTRQWGCAWRIRVVGGPILPGVYRDREEAIRVEVAWLEKNRL